MYKTNEWAPIPSFWYTMVDSELRDYIHDVVTYKDLHEEIAQVRKVLVGLHTYHHFTVTDQQARIKRYDQMFKALLTEKARQEVLNKMSNHKSSNTKDTGTGKTDDTGSSVGVGNILKEQVTGCGE
jgi:hypothetical protein